MLDRDLKNIAMQMATLLPDDKQTAKRVHTLLNELIEGWLYEEGKDFFEAGSDSGAASPPSDSAVIKFAGKPLKSPTNM